MEHLVLGKTSMIFEPMIARDIEKKRFFKEASKEIGFTALKTGLANLNCPYTNKYINDNFSLNMLTPISNKEKTFKNYVSKLTFFYDGENSVYKNLGLTYLAPDFESLSHIQKIADNFGFKYYLVDPNNKKSMGLNPFAYSDPIKSALAISSILRRMHLANIDFNERHLTNSTEEILYQAVENLSILLKEMYPLLHDSDLPTLENLLELLNDFNEIEQLAEKMKRIPELAKKYNIQLSFIEKNFYRTAENRNKTFSNLQLIASTIESLIRYPGIKNILCNQTNNINYDDVLKNGDIILVCTRRGDLGATVHKTFGLFVLLLMQQSVLTRPGNETTRIPHFLYIDEFAPFECRATEDLFTLYRKYRVGTIVSAQNMAQFRNESFRKTIMANSTTKLVFGNNLPEDNQLWEKEFGEHREWVASRVYKTAEGSYSPDLGNIAWDWRPNVKAGQLQGLKFKMLAYKTKDVKGRNIAGRANVNFLDSKYKEKQKIKSYNFEKFTNGINIKDEPAKAQIYDKLNINNLVNETEIDPVKDNNFNSHYKFDDEDPIADYNKRKNNNA